MDLLAHISEFAGEQHLHLRVDILHIVLNHELATICQLVDVLQLRQQLRQLVFLQQSDALQHGDMRHRAQHVVLGQIKVHLTVTTDGETLYLLIDLKVLFPKFHIIRI